MLVKTILALLLAVSTAQCQTPPDFEPSTGEKLAVKFSEKVEADQGNKLDKADTQNPPQLNIKTLIETQMLSYYFPFQKKLAPPSSPYIVFMVDLDVPQNGSTVPFLHWYQPDLNLETKSGNLSVPKSSKFPKAEYMGPSPPPGPEHRYVELLFEQPSEYKFPKDFKKYLHRKSSARVGFKIQDFVEAADLKKPVAGNWFLVQETQNGKEDL